MKLALQYLTDQTGTAQAVQLSLTDWQRVMARLVKYEQALKLKSDFQEALDQVSQMRKSGKPKQTLTEFLNKL